MLMTVISIMAKGERLLPPAVTENQGSDRLILLHLTEGQPHQQRQPDRQGFIFGANPSKRC